MLSCLLVKAGIISLQLIPKFGSCFFGNILAVTKITSGGVHFDCLREQSLDDNLISSFFAEEFRLVNHSDVPHADFVLSHNLVSVLDVWEVSEI